MLSADPAFPKRNGNDQRGGPGIPGIDRISGMPGKERLAAARLREPRKRVLKPEGVAVSMDQQPVRDVA